MPLFLFWHFILNMWRYAYIYCELFKDLANLHATYLVRKCLIFSLFTWIDTFKLKLDVSSWLIIYAL